MKRAREPSVLELALAHDRGENLYRDISQPPARYDSATGLPIARRRPVTWRDGADGPLDEPGPP